MTTKFSYNNKVKLLMMFNNFNVFTIYVDGQMLSIFSTSKICVLR